MGNMWETESEAGYQPPPADVAEVWTEADVTAPLEDRYGQLLRTLYALEDRMQQGELATVDLTPEAKDRWVSFFDDENGRLYREPDGPARVTRAKGISHAGGSSTRRARRASVFRRNVKRTEDTETVKRAHFVDPPRFSLRSAPLWGSGGRQFPGSNEDAGVRLAGWSPTGGGTKISPSAPPLRPGAPVRSPPDAPLVSRGRAPGRHVEILLP